MNADYSISNNPSGTWSYGRKWSVTATAMDLFTVPWVGGGWYLGNVGDGGPSVQGTRVEMWAKANANGYPCGRWTCPMAGTYSIIGNFTGNDSRGVDNYVYVIINGSVTFSNRVQSYLQTVCFTNTNVALNQGDFVDFTLVWGGTGSSEANWTSMQAIISTPDQQTPYSYTTNTDNTITITGYSCPTGGVALTITNTINGLPVTSIGDNAFAGCTNLTSVTIPTSVTSLGYYAFDYCTGLTSVMIPNSVTNIDIMAFANCTGLTNVTIPNGVTSIGSAAFLGCSSLTNVTIPSSVTSIGHSVFVFDLSLTAITVDPSNPAYGSWGGVLFDKNQTTLIQYPEGKIGNTYTIPNTVTTIDYNAFASSMLTNVTIPASVTSIRDDAFLGCSSLTAITVDPSNPSYSSLAGVLFDKIQTTLIQYPEGKIGNTYTIPNTVTTIGWTAFSACTSLSNVVIGSSITSIGSGAFQICFSLSGVYFQGNAPGVGSDTSVFNGDTNTVYYLAGTTGWGPTFDGRPTVQLSNSFQGYTYTANNGAITITGYTGAGGAVTIPSTINGLPVTSIGDYAFLGTALTTLSVPDNVTSIGIEAFESCRSLASVTIGNGVTNIGNWAFEDCQSLTTIAVDTRNSFYSSFWGVLFDKNQTTLIGYPGGRAGSYTIPNSVTSIGVGAFQGCGSLTSVTIPSSITNISDFVFGANASLTAITVVATNPVYSSVAGVLFDKNQTTIVAYPGGINGSYTIPNSVTIIGVGAFENCYDLTNVTIPTSITSIRDWAFGYCTNLTSVIIPASVTSIGSSAFFGCPSLTSVYFQGNAPSVTNDVSVFSGDPNTVYYLAGTTGWGATFDGRPTVAVSCTVVEWGYNVNGEANVPAGLSNVTAIAAGALSTYHTLALRSDGTVVAWGDNQYGETTGIPNLTAPYTAIANPVVLNGVVLSNVTAISTRGIHTVALKRDGTVVAWGDDQYGETTGTPNLTAPYSAIANPVALNGQILSNVTAVAAGRQHTVALRSDGTIVAWGDNTYGESTIPAGLSNVTAVAAGGKHTLALRSDGTVVAWGDNTYGVSTIPAGLSNVWAIAAGGEQTVALVCANSATVTVAASPSNGGTVTGGGTFPVGLSQSITATANSGWRFTGWSDGGAQTHTITVPATNVTYTAGFISQAQGYTYTTNSGAITITGYTGPGGAVTIPSTINGLPVTSLGYAAFDNNTNLTSVTIPDGVTSIGDFAFDRCSSLTNVTIGNGVTSIGGCAFQSCALTGVTVPNSVTNIIAGSFYGCPLTAITVGSGNLNYISVGGVLFDINQTTLIVYPAAKAGSSYIIPNSVTRIAVKAFGGCSTLASITIPNSVTSIGNGAFCLCPALTGLSIPASVTNIEGNLFLFNSSLPAITVDPNNPSYSSVAGVLFDKGQTTLIDYPTGKTGGTYTIPTSVTSILEYAFSGSALTNVTIPAGLTSLEIFAFEACAGLTGAYFQGNAPSVTNDVSVFAGDTNTVYYLAGTTGWGATFDGRPTVQLSNSFQGYTYTANNGAITITGYAGPGGAVTIPSTINGLSVTGIGVSAFRNNTNVTSVAMTSGVTSIGLDAFYNCNNLTSVMIPDGVISIGVEAFAFCTNLTSVTIPSSVTNIGASIFYDCTSLTSATIHDGVTNIPEGMFYACNRLTSVTIPASVTSLGSSAFAGCTALTAVYFQGNAPGDGSDTSVFSGDTNTVYYLPGTTGWGPTFDGRPTVQLSNSFQGYTFTANNGAITITGYTGDDSAVTIPSTINGLPVISIGNSAFQSNTMTSVTIPTGVTSIGVRAFAECFSLTNVTIPTSITSIGQVAFWDCFSLTNVTIPTSITSIGDRAFWRCALNNVTIPASVTNIGVGVFFDNSSLTAITVDPNNPAYCNVAGVLFDKTQTALIQYPLAKSGSSYTIPASVTTIRDWAFGFCTNLTSVIIPASVTSIGQVAFWDCTSLTGAYFQGNAPSFGTPIFTGDNKATVYYLPGTTGWANRWGGRPTAIWTEPVTVVASPTGGGAVSGGGTYPVGSSQSIAASANSGWTFSSWSDGSTQNPYTITVPTSNITYTAFFVTTNGVGISGITQLVTGLSTNTTATLTKGRVNSLLGSLAIAQSDLSRIRTNTHTHVITTNIIAACAQLNGFLIKVKVYKQLNILSPTDAAALTAAATAERAALGCR